MANYYVSTSGNDSTGDGLSPGSAWRTIGKAVGGTPAITLSGSGDTLYIAPGIYRESVTLALSPTSAGRLSIVGDATGSIFGVAPGVVDWRAWTDDATPISGSCLTATSSNYVTLDHLKMIGGSSANGACVNTTTCTNWTIRDCVFIGFPTNGMCCQFTCATLTALNYAIDRCTFVQYVSNFPAVRLFAPLATADWSLGVTITNCYMTGSGIGVQVRNSGGTGTFVAGGVAIQSCTFSGLNQSATVYLSQGITAIPAAPVTIYGCLIIGGGVYANTTGQLIEDGNIIMSVLPRTAVATGTHSVTSACPALDFGDGRLTGLPLRPFGEPTAGSSLLAFGNYGTTPTVDLFNQNRPATASVGALEIETLPGTTNTYIFQVEG